MKKIFTFLGGVCLACAVGIFIFMCVLICMNPYNTHNVLLQEEINKLNQTQEFEFNTVVPFDWDKMYVFNSGVEKEFIEDTIGVSNSLIKDVPIEENTTCVIFVKDDKITAYPCGSFETIGYKINIPMVNEKYGVIDYDEHLIFYADNTEGIVELTEFTLYLKNFYEKGE